MKYIVVLGDGMADEPIAKLNNKTPLEVANTPYMDMLASKGEIGMASTIPKGMKPGSDTANLAVLGYDPEIYYSGRSPLEALSINAPMDENDVAIRVNLVTLTEEDDIENRTIVDHSSGEISTEDASVLLKAVADEFKEQGLFETFKFYTGTSYRHCLIWKNGKAFDLAQPHDHLGENIKQYLPNNFVKADDEFTKKAADDFTKMMEISFHVLNHHPINEQRRKEGKNVANSFWIWGAGTKPKLIPFTSKTNKKGAMISAVDLLKGIGKGAQMETPNIEGANAQLETNYEGKAAKAVSLLVEDGFDFAYVHVEAPDEMGHQGSIERKIKAIEYLDSRLIKKIYEELKTKNIDFRMLVMPDHPTPILLRTHTANPVPYIIYDSTKEQTSEKKYSEKECEKSNILIKPGYKIMDRLLERD